MLCTNEEEGMNRVFYVFEKKNMEDWVVMIMVVVLTRVVPGEIVGYKNV